MSHLVSGITDIFHSIYELIASFVLTIWGIVSTIVDQVVSFVAGIFSLVSHTVVGLFEVVGETGKFLIGNIFVIGLIGLGAFVWLRYQAQQGNTVKIGDKKLN